jgi:hypothetical protein
LSQPKEELAGLRRFLAAVESKSMTIHENGEDVTQREVEKLKPEIEHLESILRPPPASFPRQINSGISTGRRRTKTPPEQG